MHVPRACGSADPARFCAPGMDVVVEVAVMLWGFFPPSPSSWQKGLLRLCCGAHGEGAAADWRVASRAPAACLGRGSAPVGMAQGPIRHLRL